MANYANQSQKRGLMLLPGENPELLFTEQDRRAAYNDIKNGTIDSVIRLINLAEEGNSIQAEKLLSKLGYYPPEEIA